MPKRLLADAVEIVRGMDSSDAVSRTVLIASLSGIISELWEHAEGASRFHRQVLAAADNAVMCAVRAGTITDGQADALVMAFSDLGMPTLTQAHVDSVASRFIDEGFSPLASLFDDGTGAECA